LVLAAVGIYGVMAYWVGRRTHEIGLRMALGARSTQVLGLILGKGLLLAAIGGGLGLLGTLATNRVLGSLLFQVKPTDPATLVIGLLVIGAVVLFACWLPARRAARIDPMVALRAE
jgi:putative ABC transport system permease protein